MVYRVINGICIDEVSQQVTNPQRKDITQQTRNQTTRKKEIQKNKDTHTLNKKKEKIGDTIIKLFFRRTLGLFGDSSLTLAGIMLA